MASRPSRPMSRALPPIQQTGMVQSFGPALPATETPAKPRDSRRGLGQGPPEDEPGVRLAPMPQAQAEPQATRGRAWCGGPPWAPAAPRQMLPQTRRMAPAPSKASKPAPLVGPEPSGYGRAGQTCCCHWLHERSSLTTKGLAPRAGDTHPPRAGSQQGTVLGRKPGIRRPYLPHLLGPDQAKQVQTWVLPTQTQCHRVPHVSTKGTKPNPNNGAGFQAQRPLEGPTWGHIPRGQAMRTPTQR